MLELDVRIGTDLRCRSDFDTLAEWNSLTEQETEKVRREQVEVIVHGTCQPIEDRSRCVQDVHRGGVC